MEPGVSRHYGKTLLERQREVVAVVHRVPEVRSQGGCRRSELTHFARNGDGRQAKDLNRVVEIPADDLASPELGP